MSLVRMMYMCVVWVGGWVGVGLLVSTSSVCGKGQHISLLKSPTMTCPCP